MKVLQHIRRELRPLAQPLVNPTRNLVTRAAGWWQDHYELTGKELGEGKWGSVAQGLDRQSGEWVAIKKVAGVDAAQKEFAMQHRARGPGVVQAVHVSADPKNWHSYLVCQYMAGNSLASLASRSPHAMPGFIAEGLLRNVTAGVLRGLQTCRAAGVAHGDIHDGNILLDEHGRGHLGDFGFAAPGTPWAYANDWDALTTALRQHTLVYADLYSPVCNDFLTQMGCVPSESIDHMLRHPWLRPAQVNGVAPVALAYRPKAIMGK